MIAVTGKAGGGLASRLTGGEGPAVGGEADTADSDPARKCETAESLTSLRSESLWTVVRFAVFPGMVIRD